MLEIRPPETSVPDTILIVMRSEPTAQRFKKVFEMNGYESAFVYTPEAACTIIKEKVPTLVIIDRQFSTEANVRQFRILTAAPIIAVQDATNSCTDEECAGTYEQDVDLVVCMPSANELLARVRAILRRRMPRPDSLAVFHGGPITMDLERHEVTVNKRLVELTPKEFLILRKFLENPNRLFSRQEMLNQVWGEGYALEEHALDVHIHSLRKKLERSPGHHKVIVTIRGIGYKLRV